jgi:hypothetical protein
MSRKPLFETGKTRLSDLGWLSFVDSEGSQECHRHSTREFLLWPSNVWMKDRQESQQPKGLKRQIIDLIYEKKKNRKTRAKSRIKVNCICLIV